MENRLDELAEVLVDAAKNENLDLDDDQVLFNLGRAISKKNSTLLVSPISDDLLEAKRRAKENY